MILDYYFENVNKAEESMTEAYLEKIGAYNRGRADDEAEHNAFTGKLAVDCDEDILNAVRLVLFYNDLKDEAIESVCADVSRHLRDQSLRTYN